jgi:UPF0755 protein
MILGCMHQISPRRSFGGVLIRLLVLFILATALAAGGLWWWAGQPFKLSEIAQSDDSVDLQIPSGSSAGGIAKVIAKAVGSGTASQLLMNAWLRASGKAGDLKAGSYEIVSGDSPRSLIEKIASGKQSLRAVTFIEGWNWRQVRAALAKAKHLKNDSAALSDTQIMERLGRAGVHPEGRFFPDTYRYAKGASDITVLRAAMQTLDKQLAAAWEVRRADLPLKSPDELLIMASIVEKETGAAKDRATISGVFANRLKINMRLQTDPTVIYGMGDAFDGNIRKRDLQTDTPYNTYTRAGLPPTPIAMMGVAALQAAAQPANTRALYFVARGDGSSEFSETLDAHNRAVDKFIRGR